MVEITEQGLIRGGGAERRLVERHDRADGARTYLSHLKEEGAIEYHGTKILVVKIPRTTKSKWWGTHGEMGVWRCKEYCESVVGQLMTVKKFNKELTKLISPDQLAISFLKNIPCNVEHVYQQEIKDGVRTKKCSYCEGHGFRQVKEVSREKLEGE